MSDADTLRTVTTRLTGLPPDPDGMNGPRAASAGIAVRVFRRDTGTELENVVADLIADLGHWCDRNDQDFDAEFARGRAIYISETTLD